MSTRESGIHTHEEWKGMTQPVGLVVEPIVLDRFGIYPERNINIVSDLQRRLEELFIENEDSEKKFSSVRSVRDFCQELLGWQEEDLISSKDFHLEQSGEVISISLDDYEETIKPDWIVPNPKGIDSEFKAQLFIKELPIATSFDALPKNKDGRRQWVATPQQRFERLLKETEHPVGILWNGIALRLVYAPRGESSGHLTFPLEPMTFVDGRPMIAALEMLLGPDRLFEGGTSDTHLRTIMEQSRKEQNIVSTRLAEQVVEALWVLVRGFDYADQQNKENGTLTFRDLATKDPSHIYGGLITVLLRLVFLLYAEDEELMPRDSIYGQYYSVSGLALKLRKDRSEYQGAMEGRRGAWATLLSLFRLVFDGGGPNPSYLPARFGELFDPNIYPFLEGRVNSRSYKEDILTSVPPISDSVVEQVLTKLLILDGQILSYRSLDVEQIGSVYEGIMGFNIEVLKKQSIGILCRPNGQKITIPFIVNAEELLAQPGAKRDNWLKKEAGIDLKLSIKIKKDIKQANNLNDLCQALDQKLSIHSRRGLEAGSVVLQPTEERRRSGSHYTPRALTEPIVAESFRPWLESHNFMPSTNDILNLKVCDPAMGSGAFLVATCRFLAKYLVSAWDKNGLPPECDETFDKDNYARRLISQNCLYGVDKNPFAVSLAKLSLWLVTLSKELPFTFVDHSLKCGDSLIGFSISEIQLARKKNIQMSLIDNQNQFISNLSSKRKEFFSLDNRNDSSYKKKEELLKQQSKATEKLHQAGDLMIAAFFNSKNTKERFEKEEIYLSLLNSLTQDKNSNQSIKEIQKRLSSGKKGIKPFHWDLEFPEVFKERRRGFDVFIGNPPFAGIKTIEKAYPSSVIDWLKTIHPESGGQCDLAAHFFRKSFHLLNQNGVLGLISTNTIFQGDTRKSGLRWICKNGGIIYSAKKRYKWPGSAAVIVSIIHLTKIDYKGTKKLNSRIVNKITAFLEKNGGNEDPKNIPLNHEQSYKGVEATGKGFIFDDSKISDIDTLGIPSPIALMEKFVKENSNNKDVIYPYIGGDEVNSKPDHSSHRYIINFGKRSYEECHQKWPDLISLLELKVKPERLLKKKPVSTYPWWLLTRPREEMVIATKPHKYVLVTCRHQSNWQIAKMKSNQIFSDALVVFPPKINLEILFSIIQSQTHEIWARRYGSSIGDGLRYTPTDCYETFPFPRTIYDHLNHKETEIGLSLRKIQTLGQTYIDFRSELMINNNEGLTSTYNRFNSPKENSENIYKLRELHNNLDRELLNLYGWSDISLKCGFVPDYLEIDQDIKLPINLKSRLESNDLFFLDSNEAYTFETQLNNINSNPIKSWRYRWPDEVVDEVLDRLYYQNLELYEESRQSSYKKKNNLFKRSKKSVENNQMDLNFN